MQRYVSLVVFLLMFVPQPVALRAEDPKPEDNGKAEAKADESKDLGDKDDKDEKEKKKKKKDDRYFALEGGTVHTVTGGDLFGVTILAKNGKIIEIGESVTIPEKTEVLDASALHVYPGLVAAASGGILGTEPPDDSTNVFSLPMTIALAGGITTAVTGNTAGKLSYGTLEDMIVKRDLFYSLSYSTTSPDGRRKVREKFDKVRQYIRDFEAFEEKKKKDPETEEPDKDWLKGDFEKIHKLLRGELTAVGSGDTTHEIVQLCEFAEQYGIKLVIRGAMEGWTVPSRMARAGVSAVLTIRPPIFSMDTGHDERLNRPTGRSIENAAILYRHGIQFAIVPSVTSITLWGLAGRDLLHLNMEAAFAVRGGLPDEAGLRSITIDAAKVLGIDHRVGSIEVGKDADFVVTDGDILHYMTHARWTIVNGRIAYDKQKETLYSHIRPDGDRDAPPPDDYWPRRLAAE